MSSPWPCGRRIENFVGESLAVSLTLHHHHKKKFVYIVAFIPGGHVWCRRWPRRCGRRGGDAACARLSRRSAPASEAAAAICRSRVAAAPLSVTDGALRRGLLVVGGGLRSFDERRTKVARAAAAALPTSEDVVGSLRLRIRGEAEGALFRRRGESGRRSSWPSLDSFAQNAANALAAAFPSSARFSTASSAARQDRT